MYSTTCSDDRNDLRTCCKTCNALISPRPGRRISSTVLLGLVDSSAVDEIHSHCPLGWCCCVVGRPRAVGRMDRFSLPYRRIRQRYPPGRRKVLCRESQPTAAAGETPRGRTQPPEPAGISRSRSGQACGATKAHFFVLDSPIPTFYTSTYVMIGRLKDFQFESEISYRLFPSPSQQGIARCQTPPREENLDRPSGDGFFLYDKNGYTMRQGCDQSLWFQA